MVCGIYLITFKRTGQKYVGYSNDIDRRFNDHSSSPKSTSWIDRAILKYGIENFSLTVLEETVDDEHFMGEREKYWIKELNTYEDDFHYNLTPGGENPPVRKGMEHPQYRADVPSGENLFNEWLYGENFRSLASKYDCSKSSEIEYWIMQIKIISILKNYLIKSTLAKIIKDLAPQLLMILVEWNILDNP